MVNRQRCFAITGAAGFVGGRLSSYLLSKGHAVIALSRDINACKDLESMGAKVRAADVRYPEQLDNALRGVDGVFHVAALFNNPERSWQDYRDVNVTGTLNVLDAASKAGVERVVHCSTIGVATEAAPPPYSEDTPYSPQSGDKYEVTKTEGEIAAREFARESGLSLVVIRPAQVYGPGDLSKKKFYKLVKKGVIVNPGETRKHPIYIDDLCEAFLTAMTLKQAEGEIFVIAGPESISLKKLVQHAANALNVGPPRLLLPAKPVVYTCAAVERICNAIGIKPILFRRSMDFFTRSVECDITKAKQVLGFIGRTDIESGVARTVAWLKEQNEI